MKERKFCDIDDYLLLNDNAAKMFKEISDITITNYGIEDNSIKVLNILNTLEELKYVYEQKCEELENLTRVENET